MGATVVKSLQREVRIGQVSEPALAGLEILYRAYRYAIETRSEIWAFAVEITLLEEAGLSNSEFRWLLKHGYVEHAEEVTLRTSAEREFRAVSKHRFTEKTCFVLCQGGVEYIEGHRALMGLAASPVNGSACLERANPNGSPYHHAKPCWDRTKRTLVIDERLVKVFRWPAPNQELVLDVFQEEEWTRRIDDPLPVVDGQDPRRRLHDTIKCLNRNLENRLIRFRGDGRGDGVTWELVSDPTGRAWQAR
jgi:hypothetical protein